jgi:uncharacterized protein YlxW (UPF0749 family)
VGRAKQVIWAALAAVLGFAGVTAGYSAEAAKRADQPRRDQLIDLISQRQSQVASMEETLEELTREAERAGETSGRLTAQKRAAAEALSILEIQAGTVPMEGPGVVIELADSDRPPGPGEDAVLYRVHDVDIQLLVNALFSSGAEAVAVDGQRVVSTTAVRAAGQTILVNYRPLVPPYRIVAIGVGAKALKAHPVARRLTRWNALFGLGFSVENRERVTVAAHPAQIRLRNIEARQPASTAGSP